MHAILLLLLLLLVLLLSSRSILWIDLDDDGRLLFAAPGSIVSFFERRLCGFCEKIPDSFFREVKNKRFSY